MGRRSRISVAIGSLALVGGLVAAPAHALPLGNHIVIVSSTTSIVTGDSWTVTVEVQDLLGSAVPGATIWTGIEEPSLGCGADFTASACTGLAGSKRNADGSGQLTLTQPADLDTFVLLYLSDSQDVLDPTTAQSVSIRTHNSYAWSGPSSATLKQYAIGAAPYMLAPNKTGNKIRMATGTGAAKTVRTEVSTDGGTTWTVIGRGFKRGVFPLTGSRTSPVDHVNLMASQPGTYSVRVSDTGGTYEDPGVSPVVTVTVTKRGAPEWLRRTNQYRTSLGLAPVVDNPVYDAAVAKHVHWMNIHNQLSHSEPTGTKGYTKEGNEAASASVLGYGHSTASSSVDGWIGAPFHAQCLLNAYWAVGGYASENGWSGEWCHSTLQTLDLAAGANAPVKSTLRKNYTFPSSAMKVPLTVMLNGNEAPDPVAGCARRGVGPYWSVPIIFRVAKPPAGDRGLRSARGSVRTKSGHRIKHTCLITGTTYVGPDSGSTQIGRLILGDKLTGRWAIVLVKAGALRAGHSYKAKLTDGGFAQKTAFTVARS